MSVVSALAILDSRCLPWSVVDGVEGVGTQGATTVTMDDSEGATVNSRLIAALVALRDEISQIAEV